MLLLKEKWTDAETDAETDADAGHPDPIRSDPIRSDPFTEGKKDGSDPIRSDPIRSDPFTDEKMGASISGAARAQRERSANAARTQRERSSERRTNADAGHPLDTLNGPLFTGIRTL
jgi:hypothetical protein